MSADNTDDELVATREKNNNAKPSSKPATATSPSSISNKITA